MFYKVKQNDAIVDALDNLQCVRLFGGMNIILRCKETEDPQGIISTDGQHIWQVDGWTLFPDMDGVDGVVRLSEIDEETYRLIRAALDEGSEIPEEPEQEDDPEPETEETLEFIKKQRIAYSKKLLAKFLEEHPFASTAHGVVGIYAVTEEKQQLMALNYTTYQIQKAAGIDAVLTWNETGKACEEWTEEQFVQLILEVQQYVKPLVTRQQHIEMEIQAAQTTQEVMDIEISF